MLKPLRLKQSVGNALSADPDDIRTIRHSLASLGVLSENEGRQSADFMTRPLDNAIRDFQNQNGLIKDGRIDPDGPTLRRLNEVLSEVTSASRQSGTDDHGTDAPARPYGGWSEISEFPRISANASASNSRLVAALQRHGDFGDFPDMLAKTILSGGEKERHEAADLLMQAQSRDPETARRLDTAVRNSLEKQNPGRNGSAEETQVAVAPAIFGGYALTELLLGGAAAFMAGDMLRKSLNDNNEGQASERTTILPPQPNMITDPPPHPDPDDPINQTKTPPHAEMPVTFPGFDHPIPETDQPQIYIFPGPSANPASRPYYESKGIPPTKKQLDTIRDNFLDSNPDEIHRAGGRNREFGYEMPEEWIPGPGKAMKDKAGKDGDGRPGGRFSDLTFENIRTGRITHIQTVDVDKNGYPTQREYDAALAIHKRDRASVIMVLKNWQVEKLRRKKRKPLKK